MKAYLFLAIIVLSIDTKTINKSMLTEPFHESWSLQKEHKHSFNETRINSICIKSSVRFYFIKDFDNPNDYQFFSENWELFLKHKVLNSENQKCQFNENFKPGMQKDETQSNIHDNSKSIINGSIYYQESKNESENDDNSSVDTEHWFYCEIKHFDQHNSEIWMINETVFNQNNEKCFNTICSLNDNSNIFKEFYTVSNIFKNWTKESFDWNELNNERYADIFFGWDQWYTIFDISKFEHHKSWINSEYRDVKSKTVIMYYQLQYYLYVFLFNFWCLTMICNQISHVDDSISSNDSRLSNIAHLVIDICHTLFTVIPFFWPLYKYYEAEIGEMANSTNFEDNQYVFGFMSIYILWAFAFIALQRLLLLRREELKAWHIFIKNTYIFKSSVFYMRRLCSKLCFKIRNT